MSVALDLTRVAYTGDGSTTTFPITFEFIENSQIKVMQVDTTTEIESVLTEGVEYTLTGSPATAVEFGTAPAATIQVTVYRQTDKLQETDYDATGPFPAVAHETALDRIVMMIQELSYAVSNASVNLSSTAIAELTQQAVADAGTLTTTSSSLLLVKKVTGATALATIGAIEDGSVRWQQLTLLGADDALPLVLTDLSNLKLNGNMTLNLDSAITLSWDEDNSYWVETSRRN